MNFHSEGIYLNLRSAQEIAAGLVKGQRSGGGWKACCPAHDDKNPSLSINDGDDGRPLVHCQRGCSQYEVIAALRAQGLWEKDSSAISRPTVAVSRKPKKQKEDWRSILQPPPDAMPSKAQLECDWLHEYYGADDRLLCYVKRYEAGTLAPDKVFRPLTYGTLNGKPGWQERAPNAPRVLYGLNRLAHGAPDATILLCEGEKDADAAQRLFPDHICMSWMGGAGGVGSADFAPLAGRQIAIWPDADEPGAKAGEALALRLPGARVVDTAGLAKKYGAADLEREGSDPEQWLAERLAEPEESDEADDLLTVTDDDWEIASLPQRPWLAPPYLMRGQITLPHGPGGDGKSQLAIAWAVALALGKPFGRLKPKGRCRVMLTNFEDNADEQKRRISAALEYYGATPADLKGYLFRVSLGRIADATMFDMKDQAVRTTPIWDSLVRHAGRIKPDAIGLDPLVAINAVSENDNQLIRRVMVMLRSQLAEQLHCAVILIHHDNKGGDDTEASDQKNVRGGGDIVNAVRFELQVKKLTLAQAEAFGIEPERRGFYFRVGSPTSKMNYSAPDEAEWFERIPVDINGEQVVRCIPWTPPSAKLDEDQIKAVIDAVERGTPDGKPYSQRMGTEPRSIGPVLASLGITGPNAQKRAIKAVLATGRIVDLDWRVPGRGEHFTRKGLRSDRGLPYNHEWSDKEGADGS